MLSPHFLRLARRLQAIYETRQNKDHALQESCWSAANRHFQSARHYHELNRGCRSRGWLEAADAQDRAAQTALRLCQQSLIEVRQYCLAEVPSVRELSAEIRHLHEEFEGVSIDWKQQFLAAQTDTITFSGIDLGSFEIRLLWQKLGQEADSDCIEVVARQPNPATSDSYIPHPHVKDRDLCIGDGQVPLQRALEQGRLTDAFCLIRSVLQTYNPHSAYATMDTWGGYTCWNCGASMAEDERSFCEGCDQDVCGECIGSCKHCDRYRCSSCLKCCGVCADGCCARCLSISACSDVVCCPDCLGSCARCDRKVALDGLEDRTQLCEACRSSEEASRHQEEADPLNQPATCAVPGGSHARS